MFVQIGRYLQKNAKFYGWGGPIVIMDGGSGGLGLLNPSRTPCLAYWRQRLVVVAKQCEFIDVNN
jgi:hypothetical protein